LTKTKTKIKSPSAFAKMNDLLSRKTKSNTKTTKPKLNFSYYEIQLISRFSKFVGGKQTTFLSTCIRNIKNVVYSANMRVSPIGCS